MQQEGGVDKNGPQSIETFLHVTRSTIPEKGINCRSTNYLYDTMTYINFKWTITEILIEQKIQHVFCGKTKTNNNFILVILTW